MNRDKLKSVLLMSVGCLFSAAGVYNFAVAARVPVTGVAGICAILYRLTGLPMGIASILLNIPIVLVCWRLLGKAFFVRSAFCMVLYALFTDSLLPLFPVYHGDRLLAAICGAAVTALGDALIYMQNSSTGGIDFITMAIKAKNPHLPLGDITFGAAVAVILLNGIVFRDVDSVIYGLILSFISGYIVNRMIFGFSSSILMLIVTDSGTEICGVIDRVADRGSTILKAVGGWTKENKDVVMCACSNKQFYEIEKAVRKKDPCSFIIMLESNEVRGEGFRSLEFGREKEP